MKLFPLRFLTSNWIVYILLFAGLFYGNVIIFCSWLRAKSGVNLLNGWHTINEQFKTTFGFPLRLLDLKDQVRHYTRKFFLIPLLTLGILGIFQVLLSGFKLKWATFVLLLRVFGVFYVLMGTTAMQLFYILICHILARTYAAVHKQIRIKISKDAELNTRQISKKIHSWKCMILVIRNQMRNVSEFFSSSDTFFLVIKVISTFTVAYTLLQAFSKSSENDKNLFENNNATFRDLFAKTNSAQSLLAPLMIVCLAWITLFSSVGCQIIGVFLPGKLKNGYE